MRRELGGFAVEINCEATDNWYAKAKPWGCDCAHCRNFVALAQHRQLPQSVLALLSELHLPPEKATYVCELYTDEAGIHYQFSYRICGTILSSSADGTAAGLRCCHEPYPYGAPDFPQPHFDLEFYAVLPWILPESN